MRGLVEGILKLVLPEKERKSRAVLIIAREIVTSAVLMPVLEMLSDPDFWNRMLDEQVSLPLLSPYLSRFESFETRSDSLSSPLSVSSLFSRSFSQASNYIREQNLVHQLRAALDLSLPLPGGGGGANSPQPVDPRKARSSRQGISVKTDTKSFERFVKGIGKVDSLMDLRRLRSDLGGEIRKTKGSLGELPSRSSFRSSFG